MLDLEIMIPLDHAFQKAADHFNTADLDIVMLMLILQYLKVYGINIEMKLMI